MSPVSRFAEPTCFDAGDPYDVDVGQISQSLTPPIDATLKRIMCRRFILSKKHNATTISSIFELCAVFLSTIFCFLTTMQEAAFQNHASPCMLFKVIGLPNTPIRARDICHWGFCFLVKPPARIWYGWNSQSLVLFFSLQCAL